MFFCRVNENDIRIDRMMSNSIVRAAVCASRCPATYTRHATAGSNAEL